MATCKYEVTTMDKRSAKPQFVQHCSLTGHACLCSDCPDQCTRRTFANDYQARRPSETEPQQA